MTPSFNSPDQPDAPLPIAIRGPAALAAALPYLLRIPLVGRLVITTVEAGRFAQGASHVAMPDFPRTGSAELRRQWADDVGALVADGVLGVEPDDLFVAVVLYLPDGVRLQDRLALERIVAGLRQPARARTLDLIAVAGGRWRSLLCRDEECCPGEGLPILDNADAVRVCAELIGAGFAKAPEPDPAAAAKVRAALAELPWPGTFQDRQNLLRDVWPLVSGPPPELDPKQTARLVMAADRPGVRDALLSRLARAEGSAGPRWALQEALWERVLVLTPSECLAGPACMVAVACWAQGDLLGAELASGVALEADPAHRMAGLIERLVEAGVGADDWLARLGQLFEEDCLAFDRPPALWRREQRPAV